MWALNIEIASLESNLNNYRAKDTGGMSERGKFRNLNVNPLHGFLVG
jgi:hypothetical protein